MKAAGNGLWISPPAAADRSGCCEGGMKLSARGAQQKQQQAAREGGRRGERVTAGGLREAAHVG